MDWLDLFGELGRSRNRDIPMYAQILGRIKQAIASGQLPDNTRLPTNRELASLLSIDRSTVSRAYLELEKEGLIESHVGRGTFVNQRAVRGESTAPSMMWTDKFSRGSHTASAILGRQLPQIPMSDSISFSGGIPSEDFYPYKVFRDIVARLLRSARADEMFGYSPAEGYEPLRQEVLKHLAGQGIHASDDELLIVSGSQQAIDVVIKVLVDPGDVILLEEPTYFWAVCNFGASQARLIPVPVDEHGLRPDVLSSLLNAHRPKLLYTMPTFQNPTGSTMNLERRHQLLELAQKHQLPILEDNFVGDLRYDGQPQPTLKSLDRSGTVIHQGTFSKALCPGLRLGWLVAPTEVMSRLQLAKRACDLSTNTMAQAVMAEFLRGGFYSAHLEGVKAAYKSRRDTMIGALEKYIGQSISWSKPEGGLFIWAQLPAGCSSRELSVYAEREGVTFSPGEMFFVNGDHSEFFRLSFIQSGEAEIEEGVRRLAKAVDKYLQVQKRTASGTQGARANSAAAALI
jgi:2-aminoadipate transaminase